MMASLKFIMDVNVEDHEPDLHPTQDNKKDQGPGKPTTTGHPHEAHSTTIAITTTTTTTGPSARPRHARSPGLAIEQDINLPVPPPQTKKRGTSSGISKSSASSTKTTSTATGVGTDTNTRDIESSTQSLSPKRKRPSARRRSTTSTDSMDRSQGYGSTASSSSMGGAGGPMRPMPPQPPASDVPLRLTPITGRVSRAKKGVPVHVCDICKPHKTFTRAEHLRRHQLSHTSPGFQCPGCDKAFHRQDLLTRHQQKSDHGGDTASKSGSAQDSPHPPKAAAPSSRAERSSGSSSVQQAGQAPVRAPAPEMPTPSVSNNPYGELESYPLPGTMPPMVSVISPGSHYTPRTAPPVPLHLVTDDLLVPGLQQPDYHEQRDASPWPSSATDSSYSTPVSEPRNPRFFRGTQTLLSQIPGAPGAVDGANMEGMPVPPMYMAPYTSIPPQQQPSYDPNMYSMAGVASIGYGAVDSASHHQLRFAASQGLHDNHIPDIRAIRDPSPPSNTGAHANRGLLTHIIIPPPRLDPMEGRKPAVVSHNLLGPQVRMNQYSHFQQPSAGYDGSGNASPSGDSGSHGRVVEELGLEIGGCSMPMPVSSSMAIPLISPISEAIPRYIETYWNQVHPKIPVVHRELYESQPEAVLTYAMAAMATQFLKDKEDRTRGNYLHDHAWQEVKRIAKWNLQTKQAILLCEYFARFRGRKAVTSPSKMFRSLYERGMYPDSMDHPMMNSDEQNRLSLEVQWSNWIHAESCRRLLTACFLVDGHTSIYQELPRAIDYDSEKSPLLQCIPLFGASEKLWEASSAEEWSSILTSHSETGETQYLPEVETLTAESVKSSALVDQMVLLGRCALRLPRRPSSRTTSVSENNTPAPEGDHQSQNLVAQAARFNTPQQAHPQSGFSVKAPEQPSVEAENRITALFGDCPIANTYLALHHTPLRDLLAVSGDSWLYSKKVLPANLFQDHQKRLRQWVTGKLAGYNPFKATVYASRALTLFLARRPGSPGCGADFAPWSSDLSDYWGLYVCALICWAFGYHAHQQGQQRQRGSSGESSPASRGGNGGASMKTTTDEDIMEWLRTVGDKSTPLETVPRLRPRREATAVVGLVRRRLESCMGVHNCLYMDAVGVLERLDSEREGQSRKLF